VSAGEAEAVQELFVPALAVVLEHLGDQAVAKGDPQDEPVLGDAPDASGRLLEGQRRSPGIGSRSGDTRNGCNRLAELPTQVVNG
jgi:hypothetical protein